MADNVAFQSTDLATPAAGVAVATDDVSGAHYQRVKLDMGGDGVSSPVTAANPLPIGTLPGGTVALAGTAQVLGSVQTFGTSQILGSVQPVGTQQGLGTYQPLAGSVHLASRLPGTADIGTIAGTVQTLGTFQVAGTAQILGTAQLLGTIPIGTVAGTVQSLGTFQSHGTNQALGTMQPLAGSVHLASRLPGTVDVGTIAGTIQVLGSVQAVGTNQALGTFQVAGTAQILGTIQTTGTVSVGTIAGTVRPGTIPGGTIVVQAGGFGSYFGTAFTATTTDGTLIAALGQGTRWRLFDVTVSASAAGTVRLAEGAGGGTTVWGPLFFAANGGMQVNSGRGYLARGTNLGLYATTSAGTTAITVNYALET